VSGRALDAAVDDLARRFRAALEPRPVAGVTSIRQLRRACEPLRSGGQPLEGILAELEAKSRMASRRHRRALLRLSDRGCAARGRDSSRRGRPRSTRTSGCGRSAAASSWSWSRSGLAGRPPRLSAESGYFAPRDDGEHRRARVARHAFGKRHGVDVMQQRRSARCGTGVYGSEELHLSDHKALRTLGLARECVRATPSTSDTRCAWTPCATRSARPAAGSSRDRDRASGFVNTGACDPLAEIAEVCATGPLAPRGRRLRSVLSDSGSRRRRSSGIWSAPTRWPSTRTNG